MEIKIVSFGNDTNCSNVEDLIEKLKNLYMNQSVAIHYKKTVDSLKKVFFVDVNENAIVETYKEEKFNFSQLS